MGVGVQVDRDPADAPGNPFGDLVSITHRLGNDCRGDVAAAELDCTAAVEAQDGTEIPAAANIERQHANWRILGVHETPARPVAARGAPRCGRRRIRL